MEKPRYKLNGIVPLALVQERAREIVIALAKSQRDGTLLELNGDKLALLALAMLGLDFLPVDPLPTEPKKQKKPWYFRDSKATKYPPQKKQNYS